MNNHQLIDNHGRAITYLRLAITDRCNLRCRYCRPASGVPFLPHGEILSLEEMERLVRVVAGLGVRKLRLTGGEPFSRRGCVDFMARVRRIDGIESLYITTNGVKTARFLDELVRIGVDGINLSLDTLDAKRFWRITRRDYLDSVLATLYGALERGLAVKVNSVVLADTTDDEIRALAALAERHPLTVRFIEPMPFSAGGSASPRPQDLLGRLAAIFGDLEPVQTPASATARVFTRDGMKGALGVISGFSRQFCAACNKIRITPAGMLKTCLYDNGVLDLKGLLRRGADDQEVARALTACVGRRHADGHETERACARSEEPSMGLIGG